MPSLSSEDLLLLLGILLHPVAQAIEKYIYICPLYTYIKYICSFQFVDVPVKQIQLRTQFKIQYNNMYQICIINYNNLR